MCAPRHYRIAYEINPWMSLKRQAAHGAALRQWQALHKLLLKLGARIRLVTPVAGLPDLVFTANAGLVHGRRFIRSRFRHAERQGEEPVFAQAMRRLGFRAESLPEGFTFEGEGDALWLGETLVYGFRFRSDAPLHEPLSALLKARVVPVELADPRFYHLDTCFCPLDRRTVLWYPKAFDRYGRAAIEALAEDVIAVSEPDARKFACNAVVLGQSVVIQAGCSAGLRSKLEKRGFDVHPVDLSEFLKSGGSAKCLVLNLRRSPTAAAASAAPSA